MPTVHRTAAAEQDLQDILFHIAVEEERPIVAQKVLDELVERCNQLAELSSVATEGTLASRIGEGVRLVAHKRWVILFRYVPDGVMILRIADGSQDYLAWRLSE